MFWKKTSSEEEAPKKSTGKKLLWGFFNAVFYIVIVGAILFGLPRFLSWYLQTPYPMAAITSGSMWPALKQGDLVFIEGINGKKDIAVGEIIVYRNLSNDTLTIHRVAKLNEETLVTKGDANFSNDEPAKYSDVIGKTFNPFGEPLRIPYMGSITVFASTMR